METLIRTYMFCFLAISKTIWEKGTSFCGAGDIIRCLGMCSFENGLSCQLSFRRGEFLLSLHLRTSSSTSVFDYALEVLRSVQDCDFLPVVVIENKIDLIDEYNFLNKDVIENSIRQARTRLYRVSAKQDFNVMHPFAYVLEKLLRYSDENANVKEKDSLQNGRLSCRQGWIERSTSTSSRKRNANCSIM
ncbi:unnamed protein product [Haemonchus placei]|uniref:GTP-binding protein Rheb n=1 Tax=Haemonchus placei TaxID=6290 RepID=A0A0N4X1L8_HAEPC|nr:unnamed protein product [Haemonchus placei]